MDQNSVFSVLTTLIQNFLNNNSNDPSLTKNENISPNFDDDFFSLPNYDNQKENKSFNNSNKQNDNLLNSASLLKILPQILNVFQNKKENPQQEVSPSYISTLRKIDDD